MPRARAEQGLKSHIDPQLFLKDPILSHRHNHSVTGEMSATFNNQTIYQTQVNFDELGNRQTPQNNVDQRTRHLIIYGGSLSFGLGLEDSQTIGAILAEKYPQYRVYNRAVGGWGPAQIFLDVQSSGLEKKIAQKQGLAIYPVYRFHFYRVLPKLISGSWTRNFPLLKLNKNGKFEYQHSFRNERPLMYWLYTVFEKFWLFQKIQQLKFFNTYSTEEKLFFAQLLAAIKDLHLNKYPASDFKFLFVGPFESELKKILADRFAEAYWLKAPSKDYEYPHDGHYTPQGALYITDQIFEKKIIPL